MLQQVFHITNNPDLNKAQKYQPNKDSGSQKFPYRGKSNDSACLSAASQLIAKLDWHIVHLSYEETDEFFIKFISEEYLFAAKFNFHQFAKIDELELEVCRRLNEKQETVINCSIPSYLLNMETGDYNNVFSSLNVLFTRLKYLADDSKLKMINEALYEDLQGGIDDELGKVASYIISFAEKLLSIRLWEQLKESVRINFNDKIKINNVKIRRLF